MANKDTEKNAESTTDDKATETPQAADAPVTETQKDDAPAPADAEPAADAPAEAQKAELTPEMAMDLLKKIYALMEGAMGGASEGAEASKADAEPAEPTRKSLMGLTEDGELVINADLLRDVQKAKAFTGKRVTAVAAAIKAMMEVLHEVDPSAVKKLVEGAPKVTAQPVKKSVEPEPEPAPKVDLGETVSAAVTKAISPLDERLKALEGARGEPKSSDGDQTTDIQKRNEDKAIFAGVV